jgi:NTE family protein
MSDSTQQATVPSAPDSPSIGLCLSGGGFRAALYGLGVVRYLAEANLLPQLVAVSAVSGGSVAAAALADRWPAIKAAGYTTEAFVNEVEQPFHEAVASHNMRNEAIARWGRRHLTLRGRSRGSAMGDVMVKRLLRARAVSDLDPELQVILTSTDLATGRAFRCLATSLEAGTSATTLFQSTSRSAKR